MPHHFQMLPVTKMNLPAKMGNAFVALGNVTAKMTAATIQMKKVVLVIKSIYNTGDPRIS